MKSKPHIAVIGAGAFGGWTALHLLERGAHVTLLDAWGPGNSRASSGGETRIMRGTYGPDQPYTELAARALKLWAKYERRWKKQFLHRTGVLWMVSSRDDAFERGSLAMLRASRDQISGTFDGADEETLAADQLRGLHWGIFEPECGYLDARASCQAVVDAFVAKAAGTGSCSLTRRSGECRDKLVPSQLHALERLAAQSRLLRLRLRPVAGQAVSGNYWRAHPSHQAGYFFLRHPAGDSRFTDPHLPVWGDHGKRFFYGIPGSDRRGFKIADDTRGAAFDPTNGERVVSQETLKDVREYIAFRFPAMKDAPLVETRVCQYEQTPDSDFVVDRHPRMENVWLLGGGSGHGFKHGPAMGEMMAELILKDGEPKAIWRLARFKRERLTTEDTEFTAKAL